MIKNYFKIALRQLWRNKMYSLLNITGLALGLAVSLLILLFVSHEFSYDRFHTQSENIYRVWAKFKFGQETIQTTAMSAALGAKVMENSTGVKNMVRFSYQNGVVKSDENHIFDENAILLADPSFLEIFDFKVLKGNTQKALQEPMSVLLTEKTAEKYFGTQDVIGKVLTMDKKLIFKVVGVVKNPPSNSSIQFDFLASLSSLSNVERYKWRAINDDQLTLNYDKISLGSLQTYFLVNNEKEALAIPQKIQDLIKQQLDKENETRKKEGKELLKHKSGDGVGDEYMMQALTDVHLGANGLGASPNAQYIYIFLSIALIILALALINYMSLTTARATQRAKEVGVRKVAGASQARLIGQFYMESTLVTLFSFVLGLFFVEILRVAFFETLNLKIDSAFLYTPWFLAVIAGLFIFTVLFSGSYPALLLSKFSPVEVLKGKFSNKGGNHRVRQTFTVFQFAVSIALIVCTLLVQKQLNHLRSVDIGMEKSQVLALNFGNLKEKYQPFKQEIRQLVGIEQTAYSNLPLFKDGYNAFFIKSPENQKDVTMSFNNVDESFLSMFGLEWVSEPLDKNQVGNEETIIINEVAAKEMGMDVNKKGVKIALGKNGNEILGVMKDFIYDDLHSGKINPLAIFVTKDTLKNFDTGGTLYLKMNPKADVKDLLGKVEKISKKYNPEQPFSYYFLDEAYDNYFKAESRLSKMLSAFTAFAVFISCLGLFGLATFTAESRVKEIGIRKVLGASVLQITTLLSKDFIKLILWANVLGLPVAYYLIDKWLADFSYKTEISWWLFGVAGVSAILIALFTVSWQSIKAALMNPVKSLRSE
jgi:putative ABC transport system permease protein